MDKGIYCLVFENPACTVLVGALGDIPFAAGWHVYIGSALGSGGLQRLERHISLAKNRDRHPKWHVDYLLADPHFLLSAAVFAPTTGRLECPLAEAISGAGITGFGCSDCTCRSHLLYRTHDPQEEVMAAFLKLGLSPVIKTIMSRETKANL
jgi:Uri superfamily endonuclease